jgi:diadenosine tetraphosphatase ApaH/serine/threonine PP2A family protein phosphatase
MSDEARELFDKHDDEFLKFERVPQDRKLSNRPDLCAFLLLDRLVPGGTSDIVAGAAHDEIWLDTDVDKLIAVASEDDIVTLVRCGVRYDEDIESLAMFA